MAKKILSLAVFILLIAASNLLAADFVVNDFEEFAAAVENSTDPVNTIDITAQVITSTGSLDVTGQNIDFNFLQADSVFDFDNNIDTHISVYGSSLTFNADGITFQNGYGTGNGSVFSADNSTMTFNGTTIFSSNSANQFGGAVYTANGSMSEFNGRTAFYGNEANHGGAVYAENASGFVFSESSAFYGNKANSYGGAIHLEDASDAVFNSAAEFTDNSALAGGAFTAIYGSSASFNGQTEFTGNTATLSGGAVYVFEGSAVIFNAKTIFNNNLAGTFGGGGGAAAAIDYSNITFNGETIFSSNSASSGGAVASVSDSTITFTGETMFSSNSALLFGGAVYSEDHAEVIFGSSSSFYGNSAGVSGGAAASAYYSNITFNNEAYFNRNSANSGGAVYSSEGSTVAFNADTVFNANKAAENGGAVFASTGSKVFFNNNAAFNANTADLYGGALYSAYGADIIFNSSSSFNANSAEAGGAAAAQNSNITFNSTAAFSGNTAYAGGAIHAAGISSITFNGNTIFSSNTAEFAGGAVLATSASGITFNNETIFSGNLSERDGGAVYSDRGSNILFGNNAIFLDNNAINGGAFFASGSTGTFNGEATFSSNSALNGGALYTNGHSYIRYAEKTDFTGNTAKFSGGALFIFQSNVLFDNETIFANNKTTDPSGSGGAIHAAGISSITFNGNTIFSSNTAAKGGAIAAYDYSGIILDGAEFYGNSASEYGGAVYLSNSAHLVLNADQNRFVFENNTAGGEMNDIYATGSSVTFNALNYDITINGGIKDDGSFTNFFYKTGANTLYLNGINDFTADTFEIAEGNVEIIKDSNIGINNLKIGSAGGLNILNGSQEEYNIYSLMLDGKLYMDADDKIITHHAELSGDLIVSFEKLRPFQSGVYALINSYNSFTGSGLTLSTEGVNYNRIESIDLYETSSEAGYEITIALLEELPGLTGNQKETAKALDRAFVYAAGDSISEIDYIDGLSESMKKKALDELSGSFIANVIKAGAANSAVKTLYRHIKNPAENQKGRIWAHGYANGISFDEDNNSTGKFDGNGFGIQAGWDIYNNENDLNAGLYINYEANSYEQEKNKADMTDFGIGLYGGLFRDQWTFKGSLKGAIQNYDTERKLTALDGTVKGDFGASAFGINAQAQYAIPVNKDLKISPYGGLEFSAVSYGNYKEKNMAAALDMQSGSYVAGQFTAGAEVEGKLLKKLNWNASAGLGLLFAGAYGEFEAKIYGEKIEIKGAEQGTVTAELSAGAEYEITKNINIYANVDLGTGSGIMYYTATLGAGYKIGR